MHCSITRSSSSWGFLGRQVTYQDLDKPDVVKQHGQTNGSSLLLVDLPQGQFLNQVIVWSSDKVYGLYLNSSNGIDSATVGSPVGRPKQLQKPMFGFYGGDKDGALVSLGFYTLVDFAAARGKTPMVGGEVGTYAVWDDTGSYNGTCPPALAKISVITITY